MQRKLSAGILLYRQGSPGLEVFLVHPGGPFFQHKDDGAWSLPKGECLPDEDPLEVARREFAEETGRSLDLCAPNAQPEVLGRVEQRNNKTVIAWAVDGDWPDDITVSSNLFQLEWPPHSGRFRSFPEVDRGGFFDIDSAQRKLIPAQTAFLDRLLALLET